MSNYPTSKDELKVDTAGTDPMSAHAELHNDANEAINAIQDFIGTSENGGSTTIVDGINIISGHVEAIENALGVTIDIDVDGNVTIAPNGEDPVIPIPSDDSKFDLGSGTTNLNDATQMEAAIDANTSSIENVILGLGGSVNPDGSIDITVDGLPDQSGADGKFLTTDGSDASWGDVPSDDAKLDKGTSTYSDAKEIQDAIETISSNGYDDSWIQPALDGKADDPHTHADLATEDHTHDDLAADDHNHDGDYATEDHTHDPDDTKLDKGTTTYVDAKAIEDDISGIEQSISDLSDNYDQIVIDLGDAGKDLTVELGNYLKKGTASYADAAGIETDIDQEKKDRAEADAALSEEIAKIVVPDVSDFVTEDDMNTALSGKADEPHTHDDLAAGDHEHDGVYATEDHTHDEYLTDLTHDHDGTYQPVGDYATTEELTDGLAGKSDDDHTHDTTHDHEEYFLAGAEVDEFGQPIPLPYANAKLLGDAVDTKADEDHTHDDVVSFEANGDLFCNNIVTLTQADYDALTDRDPHTLYLAVDA